MTQPRGEEEAPPCSLRLWPLVCALRLRAAPSVICSLLRALRDDHLMTPDSQELLLDQWASPTAALLPADSDYTRRVLRAVVLAAEGDDEEANEQLMQLYTACLLGKPGGASSPGGAGWPGAPPPPPGWCYKLYAYAPAAQPTAAMLQHLAHWEQRVLQRCGWQAQRQQAQQQQAQQGQQEEEGDEEAPRSAALPPLTAGDGRSGLLALHVSLNLLEGGTGCHEWEAGFFLAEWVLSHPELVAGRCCLEVGCGTGMVGVVLHRCGAAAVLCTDGDPHTVANCRRNLQLNGVPLLGAGRAGCRGGGGGVPAQPGSSSQGWADCRRLCWEDGWSGGAARGGQTAAHQPTLVFGADLLYDPTVIPALLALLKQVLAARAAGSPDVTPTAAGQAGQRGLAAAYLATTLRNEATLLQFVAAAEADPAIRIQQLAGGETGAGPAADDGCGTGSSNGGGTAGGAAIRFQHLPELEGARHRIFLHRLTLARGRGGAA